MINAFSMLQKLSLKNDSKRRRMDLFCIKKNLSALLREIMSKHDDDFIP